MIRYYLFKFLETNLDHKFTGTHDKELPFKQDQNQKIRSITS